MPTIAVLTHECDRFLQKKYLLREMSGFWRAPEYQVVVQSGTTTPVRADLAILHVDLTVIPEDYLAYAETFPRVLNGRVRDISKRVISRNEVVPGDGYAGPVIVKTDLNSGGGNEAAKIKGGHWLRQVKKLAPWSMRGQGSDYRIFLSPKKVPSAVWSNRKFFVERFLAEKLGDLYCLRTWVFFGDKESNSICYSRSPIIKASNVIRRQALPDVPDQLRQVRAKLGFDYGKFDYVMRDGEVVLYDTNRTPSLGDVSEEFLARMGDLSEGIKAYI